MSARRQREVLSPIVTNNRASLTGVTCSPSTLLMEQQDDELERKARRRSRVMDLQRSKGIGGSPGSPADRRKSLPLSGLSNAQLTEHYSSCIKLSAENKINAKNAFGLHLIDYMSEMLQKKGLENFQIASTTLDASAKIYAGRVDAIHAETYKVLSGLGRGADKRKHGEEGDDAAATTAEAMEEGEEGEAVQKKKKRTRHRKIVEMNLKKLNKPKGDMVFEVDPLFQVMSATFDEGGSSGLSLNNLRTFDDTQQLVLDSNTLVAPTEDPDTSRLEERNEPVDLAQHTELFREDNYKNLLICPTFASYRFTNWDSSEESASQSQSEHHRFDMDAEPEPIPDDNMSLMGGGDGSYIDNDLEDVADTNLDDLGTDNCMGDGKAAQLVQSVMTDMSHGTTGSLMQVLATEPSDYSYFNKMLLRVWAGPSHWRAGHLPKDWKSIASKSKPKKKKSVFRVDFKEDIDFESKHFKPSKLTFLTKETLNKYSKDQTTLPKDHHYEADTLFRLFCNKGRMIKRQESRVSGIDDELDNYDYENRNDVENFCPNDEVDDDDGDVGFGDFTGGPDLSQESTSSQDPFSQSQDTFTQFPATLDGTIGGKLLSQPYKVAKIDINYAKTAKKLDVKRLKSSMWNMLKAAPKGADQPSTSTAEDEGAGNENNSATSSPGATASPGDLTFTREMDGQLSFQQMLNELPEKVCGQTARNLSVPIAFVCLLHLANEKTLKIEDKDMEDLTISQGL